MKQGMTVLGLFFFIPFCASVLASDGWWGENGLPIRPDSKLGQALSKPAPSQTELELLVREPVECKYPAALNGATDFTKEPNASNCKLICADQTRTMGDYLYCLSRKKDSALSDSALAFSALQASFSGVENLGVQWVSPARGEDFRTTVLDVPADRRGKIRIRMPDGDVVPIDLNSAGWKGVWHGLMEELVAECLARKNPADQCRNIESLAAKFEKKVRMIEVAGTLETKLRDSIQLKLTADVRKLNERRKGGKLTVCFATLNSTEEKETFKKQLNPDQFQFYELADGKPGDGWFKEACAAGVQCDALVVSAHFTGNFYGNKGSLSLAAMEEQSCKRTCPGLLETPIETFLFGCNTLATKSRDQRTPQEYRNVLQAHAGMGAEEAARVAEARYGPLGDSFRERIRRVFSGVAQIWGFDTAAPEGSLMPPFLYEFFQKKGDYKKHLERLAAERAARTMKDATEIFSNSGHGINLVSCQGYDNFSVTEQVQKLRCTVSDPKASFASRVDGVIAVAASDFGLGMLLLSELFASVDPEKLEGADRAAFEKIKNFPEGSSKLNQLMSAVTSPRMLAPLIRVSQRLGWLGGDQVKEKLQNVIARLLKPPLVQENLEVFCSITESFPNVASGMLLPEFVGEFGKMVKYCVEPNDPENFNAVLKALKGDALGFHTIARILAARDLSETEQLSILSSLKSENLSAHLVETVLMAQKKTFASVQKALIAFVSPEVDFEKQLQLRFALERLFEAHPVRDPVLISEMLLRSVGPNLTVMPVAMKALDTSGVLDDPAVLKALSQIVASKKLFRSGYEKLLSHFILAKTKEGVDAVIQNVIETGKIFSSFGPEWIHCLALLSHRKEVSDTMLIGLVSSLEKLDPATQESFLFELSQNFRDRIAVHPFLLSQWKKQWALVKEGKISEETDFLKALAGAVSSIRPITPEIEKVLEEIRTFPDPSIRFYIMRSAAACALKRDLDGEKLDYCPSQTGDP